MPALPLGDAGPYVAAAYLVFVALILVYVAIMASKLVRIERQVVELNELAAQRAEAGTDADAPAGASGAGRTAAGDENAPGGATGGARKRMETA